MLGSKLLLGSLALGLASALPSTLGKRAFADCNTPSTRSQWCGGMDINTDSETVYPPGGQIREYNLVVSAGRLAPDGVETDVLMINGSIPGPTLYADWGDTFVINVFNNMTDNGTSMHWHGVIQANTTLMDGVNGITECPIAPGRNKTYTFVATQHGTSWYHSHYSGQYGEGVLGAMVVNGPASANYDEDLGPLTISDWFYNSIYDRELFAEDTRNPPPPGESALINGSMSLNASTGSYFTTKPLAANTTYRLRLINTAVDNGYQVSLDNHNFTVIAADFVPVNATSAEWLFIGIGQRYDVLFTTGSTPGNFWFRAEVPNPIFFAPGIGRLPGLCGANSLDNPISNFGHESDIKAIFHYAGAPNGNPNSTQRIPPPDLCEENPGLTPVLTKSIPSSEFVFNSSNEFNVNSSHGSAPDGRTINTWTINESAVTVDWELPTLGYIRNGTSDQLTDSDHTNLNVYRLPEANKFYFWIIQNDEFVAPVPHPIHLHGHDFFVLGTGAGHFDGSQASALNFNNPMRRDVQMLPGNGWLVIAIHTNNPGVWLMHCHIAWHISMGLGVQFVERESELHTPEMNAGIDRMQEQCVEFEQWYDQTPFKKVDSGLRTRPGQPPRLPPRPSTPLLKARKLRV